MGYVSLQEGRFSSYQKKVLICKYPDPFSIKSIGVSGGRRIMFGSPNVMMVNVGKYTSPMDAMGMVTDSLYNWIMLEVHCRK